MKRKLSSAESIMWAAAGPALNFGLVARVRGAFPVDRLPAALAKLRQRYPNLAGRIVYGPDGGWYDMDGVPEIPVRVTAGEWAAVLAGELVEPFPVAGPLVRLVVTAGRATTDLILVCHHAIADGLAAAFVLRDLLTYAARPDAPVEPLDVPPSLEDLLPPFDPALLNFPAAGGASPVEGAAPQVRPGGERVYVLPWALSQEQTAALAARCRAEEASVHAALCAAVLGAFAQIQPEKGSLRGVSSPVSIRDRLIAPVGEAFGLYIQPGVKTRLECPPGRNLWDAAREVRQSMARDIAAPDFLALHQMGKVMAALMPFEAILEASMNMMTVDYDVSITNLGRLDVPADYGDFSLEDVYGPAVSAFPDEQIIGVSTAAGRLTCTLVSRERLLSVEDAARLRDLSLAALADAVGW